jgi:nucleoside-diphosphate-sugar epimerase
MEKSTKTEKILVSGGSGYLASHIIQQLLFGGQTVHATVRSKADENKYRHLTEIASASPGELKIFEADLLEDGSFDEAMKGCTGLIHTASPFIIGKVKDPQKILVDPALKGTRNILDSVNKTESIERVVITSSVVAIMGDAIDARELPGNTFTEEQWNESSSLKHQPYSYSKTLAEKEAWHIHKAQSRWTLTTMNPGFILGPSLTKRIDSASINFMMSMGKGTYKTGAPDGKLAVVDVRDVAAAHIQGVLNNNTSGRHILSAKTMSFLEVAAILKQTFPSYPLPGRKVPKWLFTLIGPAFGLSSKYVRRNIGIPVHFDNSYSIQDLGLKYRPVEQTLTDHFKQLINDGLLPDRQV